MVGRPAVPLRGPAQGAGPRRSRAVRPGYGSRVLDHLEHAVRVGRLGSRAAVGQAGSSSCGDLVRIELVVEDGRVDAARFEAYGCPATIAAAAEVADRVEGERLLDAARVAHDEIAEALDLPPRKRGCSGIAVDALHEALQDAVGRGMTLVPAADHARRCGVLVAMSGGVDSAVAALLARRSETHVVGVTFRLWSDPVCGRVNTCCSPAGVRRARRTAHALGAPHLTVDISRPFYEGVVLPFVEEYEAARTPNPCVRCNAGVRFDELVALADRLGLRHVVTGHYARLVGDTGRLVRARDRTKDQSYVLAQVAPRLLSRVRFPLGDLTKDETRELARGAGLEPPGYKESQEICFIPDDDHVRFLKERLGERPGDIVDTTGRRLGRHTGLYRFTVGQRRGLGVAAAEPVYVVSLQPGVDRVVVGPVAALRVEEITVDGMVRHVSPLPDTARVQLRSSGATVTVAVEDQGERVVLVPLESVSGVAPGQTAVLYADDLVLAAGTIAATKSPASPMV